MTAGNVIQGDALEELAKLPVGQFAVCVTSPPYNLGWTNPAAKAGYKTGRHRGEYSGFNDRLPRPEYIAYHRAVVAAIMDKLKEDGLLWYIHCRQSLSAPAGDPALVDEVLEGIPRRGEIVWDKMTPGPGFVAAGRTGGAFFPTQQYEIIVLIAKSPGALLDRKIAAQGNVWRIPRDRNNPHPAPFPVALAERCIAATLAEGPVLDPFGGSGSTALAAQRQGRPFTLIESAPEYCQQAESRIAECRLAPPLLLT